MRAQGLVNILVRTLLRTPGVGRVAGRYLLTLPVTGRRTGKRYHVPVAYIDHEGDILIGTAFGTLFRFWSYRRFVFPATAAPQLERSTANVTSPSSAVRDSA